MNLASPTPGNVSDLLNLLVSEPGRPRITWYGPEGERVELSGAVLQNWVSKTANLLVEEFDAGPGTRIVLDLPVHWRTVLWALGTWRCGATAQLVDPQSPAATAGGVVVSTRPRAWAGTGTDVVAQALPALARRFDDELPPGTVDAAAALMTYGDVVGWAPETDPAEPALLAPGTAPVTHGELLTGRSSSPGARVLVDGDRTVAVVLRELLDVWSADGSVVLLGPDAAAELHAEPARLARLRETERVTG